MYSKEEVLTFEIKSGKAVLIGARELKLKIPTICPRCGNGSFPERLISTECVNVNAETDQVPIASIFLCPVCNNFFYVSHYYIENHPYSDSSVIYETLPTSNRDKSFSDAIKKISPDFVRIYNQALKAENSNLTDICGPGYRKSLEFLIKDFAILNNPAKREKIIKSPLGECINTYLSKNLSALATAAAWLGNDATHYEAKHHDYGLADLKEFINSTVAYIDFESQIKKSYELQNKKQ